MPQPFADFDLSNFWEPSDYATKAYIDEPVTPSLIADVERELGVKLPAAYVALMSTQNGGIPRNCCFPTTERTSWSADHVAITGIAGIGRMKTYSLCGELGSRFMQEEWGYPEIGICVCTCPSAGHDMIMLDYREHGPQGEPRVVHVDQERDFAITFLADDFESFVRGLVNEDVYDTSEQDRKDALEKVAHGSFSTTLNALLASDEGPVLRDLCRRITEEKGHFSLHADPLSMLVYDFLFMVFTRPNQAHDRESYLRAYPAMLVFGDGAFTTGGYAPSFVESWLERRVAEGEVVARADRTLALTPFAIARIERDLEPFRSRTR